MNNKYKIFLDLEANWNRAQSELLQLSAIKVNEDYEIVDTFNQYCFNKKIYPRIANLLNKDIHFFNNKDFKKAKEIYLKFLDFSKNCELIAFGNFDQFIFEIIHRKNFKKNENIPLIKLNDIQIELTEKIGCNKDYSLSKIAKILNINQINNHHDSLEDAKILFEVYKKVSHINFNKEDYLDRIEKIKFLPLLTSAEWVERKLNNKEYKLSDDINIVFVYWKEKCVTKEINNEEIEDVFISDNLFNEIKVDYETHITINIYEFDKDMKISDKFEIKKIINKEKIEKNEYLSISQLEKFLFQKKDYIFLTNTKKFLIPFSKKFNQQFWILNYQSIPNKLGEEDVIKNTKKFISIIENIKKAINFFEIKKDKTN